MFEKRSLWITLAVLLAAIALAAVDSFSKFGNEQSNKCMGYNKSKPGNKDKSLSTGSCFDTPSNTVTVFNANGKGGPIVDKNKEPKCVTATGSKSGATVDGKPCKPVLKKGGKRRRDEDEDKAPANDTEVPDYALNPENYDWPPEQQWTKISNTSTEFETSELWQNGYGWCLEVTKDGFFWQRKCDPNNPNQNWFINFEPQPETPEAPVAQPPVVQPPVVQPPVVTPTPPTPTPQPPQPPCAGITCPADKYLNLQNCQCVCKAVECGSGRYQDDKTCKCKCTPIECPANKIQSESDCKCQCRDKCPSGQVQDANCKCHCPNTCGKNEHQNKDTCECIPNPIYGSCGECLERGMAWNKKTGECLKFGCKSADCINDIVQCPVSPGECGGDQDCPTNYACVKGKCQGPKKCHHNRDCPSVGGLAFECKHNQCVPSEGPYPDNEFQYCRGDQDCPTNWACVNGQCQAPKQCHHNRDCPSVGGLAFECKHNKCVPSEGPYPDNEFQYCRGDQDCPTNFACVNGQCQAPKQCRQARDCPSVGGVAFDCKHGQCVPSEGPYPDNFAYCRNNNECPAGNHCVNGECKKAPHVPAPPVQPEAPVKPEDDNDFSYCRDSDECPAHSHCVNHQCVRRN